MEIVDYAMPMMKIEKYLRNMHDLCLKGEYIAAAELCPLVAVETRYLGASLVLMQEAKDKLK
jgi:hypothetical protein